MICRRVARHCFTPCVVLPILLTPVVQATEAGWELLAGETGHSSRWGSGWQDLPTPTDFGGGDRLRLRIGGTASKILVRLLPRGVSPDSSVGVMGGALSVPDSRVVEIVVDSDRKNVVQISVHGGPNPWGRFRLGPDNGPATLESVELSRR